jgi:hypothetical protein
VPYSLFLHDKNKVDREFKNIYSILSSIDERAQGSAETLNDAVPGHFSMKYAGDGQASRVIQLDGLRGRPANMILVSGYEVGGDDRIVSASFDSFTGFPGVAITFLSGVTEVSLIATASLPRIQDGSMRVTDTVILDGTLNKSGWQYKALVLR